MDVYLLKACSNPTDVTTALAHNDLIVVVSTFLNVLVVNCDIVVTIGTRLFVPESCQKRGRKLSRIGKRNIRYLKYVASRA